MACETNIHEVPLSPSLPAATDMVLFTLVDGTSVLRSWGNILVSNIPDDVEVYVQATGSAIGNGDSTFNISAYIGHRVRFFRNGLKQGLDANNEARYTFNIGTGAFNFVPAARTGELFQFEAY